MMGNKMKAGRIINQTEVEDNISSYETPSDDTSQIRPEKIFGMTPLQLFVISLEIFLLVFFFGVLLLFLTGKFA